MHDFHESQNTAFRLSEVFVKQYLQLQNKTEVDHMSAKRGQDVARKQ